MKFSKVKKVVKDAQKVGKESVILVFKEKSEYAKNGIKTTKVKISDVKYVIAERAGKICFDAQEFYLRDIEEIR